MAVGGGWVWDETFTAYADLDAYQYHVVQTGSVAREIEVGQGGSSPIPLGVLQNDPEELTEATVRIMGRTKCWASTATGGSMIAYGDFLACASAGHLERPGGSTAQAIALEALAAAGSAIIEVLWFGNMFVEDYDNT